MPIVAIVGRPNVGKSTFFNRLIKERKALVLDVPGVTRDRNYGRAEYDGHIMTVIDTGGFEPESDEGMLSAMRAQAELATAEADVIVFVVDARAGLSPIDEQVYGFLRNTDKPVLVAVNKVDSKKQSNDVMEFWALGTDRLFPISSEHALGIGDLMDAVVEGFPEPEQEPDSRRARIAVIGRPNAGKSTLINQLLGQNRLIVSDIAGTTRDSIDTDFDIGETGRYTLVDTVGMRRRKAVSAAVEKFGVIKALHSIERCHVAVVVVDATEELSDQDARIANYAVKHGRGLILVLNKWDIVEKDHRTADQMVKSIRSKRASLRWAPILTLSAKTGQRATKLLPLVDQVFENSRRRIGTSELNQWFQQAMAFRPPPLHKKRAVKFYFATQARVAPPTFVLKSNMPAAGVPEAYVRYLKNRLRESWDFTGTPIRIHIRQRTSKYKGLSPD